LRDIDYRKWLGSGDWTDKSVSHRVSVVKSLERLESGLDDGHANLEEAFADDAFAALLNILIDFKNDAKSGGQKYRALMPSSDKQYKNRIISAVENVAASNLSDIAAGKSILEILTFGKGLNIKSGLPLGWQALDKVKKSEQAKRDAYFSAIGQLSRSKAPLSDAITTAGKSLSELKADGLTALTKGVILSNILCTIGCIRPEEACFAKSKILNKLGQFLTGQNLLSGRDFNVAEVEKFLDLVARIFLIMEEEWDWKPKDYFDVQGFAWAALDDRWAGDANEMAVFGGRMMRAECLNLWDLK